MEQKRLIFDTHAHYTSGAFNKSRDELLQNLPQQGVAFITDCATDYDSAKKSLELSKKYDYVYTAAGIHPESIIDEKASTLYRFKGDWRAELKEIEALLCEEKIVAVGECGLDHHWPVPHDEQLLMFEAHIRLAAEHDMPLIIHDREAHAETYALLKKYKPHAVLHAFSGSAEDVKWLCAQGVYIGFTGVLTFKNARQPLEACKAVPDEYLLMETDCPYMAPEPLRGKKSHSGMIMHTAAKAAAIRSNGEADEERTNALLRLTLENGKRFFNLL